MGGMFWDYSVNSYSGMTEDTEYQFPKEQTLCYFENRIADMTKIDVMRLRKSGYTIFPPKDGRKLLKEHDYQLQYSVYSEQTSIPNEALFPTNHYSEQTAIPNKPLFCLFCLFCSIPFILESE